MEEALQISSANWGQRRNSCQVLLLITFDFNFLDINITYSLQPIQEFHKIDNQELFLYKENWPQGDTSPPNKTLN